MVVINCIKSGAEPKCELSPKKASGKSASAGGCRCFRGRSGPPAEPAGTLHFRGSKSFEFNKLLRAQRVRSSVRTSGCDCVKCLARDPGYHRWRRDFNSDTTARCSYSPTPGDRKTTAAGDEAVKQGHVLGGPSCHQVGERQHAMVCTVTVKAHSRCPHRSPCVSCQRLKACYFQKYPSRTFTSWRACMNEWVAFLDGKPELQFCHQHHKCANCVRPAGPRCTRNGLI